MNKTIKIILVRHGQSIGNQTRVFLGHTDLDLSDLGYKQAEVTADYLKNEKIDYIFSSDLIRAYNTALPHAKLRNMSVICNKNLREAYVGAWEGMNVDDIIVKWGREMFVDQWKNNFGLFAFPDGESIKSAGERFYEEILSICGKLNGNTAIEMLNSNENEGEISEFSFITAIPGGAAITDTTDCAAMTDTSNDADIADVIVTDGYSAGYHTKTTPFEPDSQKNTEESDYIEHLAEYKDNSGPKIAKEITKTEFTISQTEMTACSKELSTNDLSQNTGFSEKEVPYSTDFTILIASHAAVIRSFWGIISGIPFDELADRVPFPTNASYSICYYKNGKIFPSDYSFDNHLLDVGITKVNLI